MLENPKHKPFFKKIVKTLKAVGYYTWFRSTNTKEHGVPQSRPRLYLVAIRKDSFKPGRDF